MSAILQKFSEASNLVSFSQKQMRDRVYDAYFNYLEDVKSDELPEKIRIIFDSVRLRLISTMPYGHIDNCDAAHVAEDIHYLAGFMRMHCSRT